MVTKGSATCFHVSDVDASLEFYTGVLGFEWSFRFGDYAGVKHGEVQVHLAGPCVPHPRQNGQGSIYIFCDDVDAYHAEISAKGIIPHAPPKDHEYQMRDFVLDDPDGNLLGFGQEINS